MEDGNIILKLIEILRTLLSKAEGFYSSAQGILDNLIAAGLGVLAAWVTYRLRRMKHRVSRDAPYYDIWNLRSDQTVTIVTGAIPDPARGQVPRMSSGDIKALTEVILSIRAMYPNLQYRHVSSPDLPTGGLDDNLVVIGGPKWNWVSRYFLSERKESPVSFEEYDIVVRAEPDDERFCASVEDSQILGDTGVICRLPHPDAPDKAVLIFAGCHTYGVLAAVRYLSYVNSYSLRSVGELERLIEPHSVLRLARSLLGRYVQHYFIAVVEVEVRGDSIGTPRLVRFTKIPGDIWEPTCTT